VATSETPAPTQQPEILTVAEAAAFLRMSVRQIYEMSRRRGKNLELPLPLLRVNGNLRFKRSSLENWVNELEAQSSGVRQ
jgi:predicted DNA-binding transcriptional regulator AlpA